MARDIELILDDILNMITVIDQSLIGKDRSDFDNTYMLQLGIQRGIEIISEASKHIHPPCWIRLRTSRGGRSAGWATSCGTNIIGLQMT